MGTPPLKGQGDVNFLQTFRFDKDLGGSRGITANDAELEHNPRARSARLRAAIRTDAPAREMAA
tara:strand:+ start:45 stop:236 length:192 start_codon:yes stop_codon:yes gene_type:complete